MGKASKVSGSHINVMASLMTWLNSGECSLCLCRFVCATEHGPLYSVTYCQPSFGISSSLGDSWALSGTGHLSASLRTLYDDCRAANLEFVSEPITRVFVGPVNS